MHLVKDGRKVFIIGPAGVGKSTCGPLLAKMLDYAFIDLDEKFLEKNGAIDRFVKRYGYKTYCKKNSDLFFSLVESMQKDIVISISSGFLMYERIDPYFKGNAMALAEIGVSILLLPSQSIGESVAVVVDRVMQRRPWLDREKETRKFLERYDRYIKCGDIQIFSIEPPQVIAKKMMDAYLIHIADAN